GYHGGGYDDHRGGGYSDRSGGGGGYGYDDRGGNNYGGRGGYGYDDRGGRGGSGGYYQGNRQGGGDGYHRGGRGGGGYHDGGRGGGGYHDGGGRGYYDGGRGRGRGGRGGNYAGGNYGGREGRRGGRGRGGRTRPPAPDMTDMTSVLSNVIMADVSEHFQFFMYSVQCQDEQGNPIDSRHRRKFLFDLGFWNGLLVDMDPKEKEDLRRVVFFQGSLFYCARRVPGLEAEKLAGTNSVLLPTPIEQTGGETIRVMQVVHYLKPLELQFAESGAAVGKGEEPEQSTEPIPANMELFTSFVNLALQRALVERLARWGTEFIDPQTCNEPVDKQGKAMGVRVYEAYSCMFGAMKATSDSLPQLGLTVDLRAKIVRTMSVQDYLCGDTDPDSYDPSFQEQERCRRQWIGEVIISMHDKKCYSVTDLIFDRSAADMPVQGLNMTHAEYFKNRKNIDL
ncbi:MAG: hypothetical protein SGARI_003256, partial [Bacillariaceae sp.]